MTGGAQATARYDVALDRLLRLNPEVVGLTRGLTTDHPDAADGLRARPPTSTSRRRTRRMSPGRGEAASALAASGARRERPRSGPLVRHRPLDRGRLAQRVPHPRSTARPPPHRPAGADRRPPARLLPRRRRQPPRPGRPLDRAPSTRTTPTGGSCSGCRRFGLEESGSYDAGRGGRPGRAGREPRRRLGGPRRGAHATRCGARSTTASGSCRSARRLGRATTSSPCTTGGTSRSSCSRRATADGPSPSTTPDAQRRLGRRPARDARRQRAAVAAPARRLDTAAGSRRWPTPGRRRGRRRAVVRVQRCARGDGALRRRPTGRGPERSWIGCTPTRSSTDAGVTDRPMAVEIGLTAAQAFIGHTEGRRRQGREPVDEHPTGRQSLRGEPRPTRTYSSAPWSTRRCVPVSSTSPPRATWSRTNLRESSVFGWDRTAQLAAMTGNPSAADGERAERFRARFAAVVPAH